MKPEVSIIVPVYNGEKYLSRCVDSVLSQTFQAFELLLVDDGSTDSSPQLCDAFARRDSRVRVLHRQNGGVSSARNAGIRQACGKYLMFCDCDDMADLNWCQRYVQEIRQYPRHWIVSDLMRIDENDRPAGTPRHTCPENPTYFQIYKLGLSAYCTNKIYLRETIRDLNLSFDETRSFAEDVGFNVRYCAACEGVRYLDTPLYFYRFHTESVMQTYRQEDFRDHLAPFSERLPLIAPGEMAEYCDIWLYQFLELLNAVFDPRNNKPFFEKMRYNQAMIQSDAFRTCLEHASGTRENLLALRLLRRGAYPAYWGLQKLSGFKNRLMHRS